MRPGLRPRTVVPPLAHAARRWPRTASCLELKLSEPIACADPKATGILAVATHQPQIPKVDVNRQVLHHEQAYASSQRQGHRCRWRRHLLRGTLKSAAVTGMPVIGLTIVGAAPI